MAAVGAVANSATAIVVGAVNLVEGLQDAQKNAVANTSANLTSATTTAKSETIINKLYGSSLEGLSAEDKKELLGSSQGSAVALALAPAPKPSATQPSIFPSSSNGPIIGGGGGGTPPTPAVVAAENDTAIVDTAAPTGDTSDTNEASTTDEAASSTPDTDEASTTPPVSDNASTTPIVTPPTGAPIVDYFDSYDGSGWSVHPTPFNSFIKFTADAGTADPFRNATTTASDCYSGSCIMANGWIGGLGGGGTEAYMYKESGVEQNAGAFTIWARSRAGWRQTTANVGLCEAPDCTPNLWFDPLGTNDDTWHQYYVAWRQGNTSIETCVLQDDTKGADCAWKSTNYSLGTQFDGILLAGGVLRPDLGDQVWFDDLANAPQ